MAQEQPDEFKARMLDKMRDLGFVINSVKDHGWTSVRDSLVDKSWERSGRFKFDTAKSTGSPVCLFKSMRRDLPTDFKRGDMSIEFARGLDKSVARPAVEYKAPTLAEKLTLDPIYRAEMQPAVEKVTELWQSSAQIGKAGHGYLTKPDLDPARLHTTADGKLLVPIFRPAAPDLLKVELAGAQLIGSNGFKQFIPGTKSGGGFALVPAHPDPNKWFDHLSNSAKPLVLCEGVGTALAIHQSTGFPVVACLTAKNLSTVAEWLKHEGHTNGREVVIFADNDLDKHVATGELRREAEQFIGIKEACKAAEIVGGKVALVDHDKHGYDAKDLLRDYGEDGVKAYVSDARTVDEIKVDRPEVFSPKQEVQQEQEPEPELAR